MKTLYILRHGKSSWEQQEIDDMDRILLSKGKKRTQRMASYLKEKKLSIDLIISSPAVRAYETAKIIAEELQCKVVVNQNLYPGFSSHILEVIFSQDDSMDSLMIVGHNPGITSLVQELIDNSCEWLPTSGLASVSFDTNTWLQIPLAAKISHKIITPKSLK